MRQKRLQKKHISIDKSILAIGTRKKVEDEKYLKSYNGTLCMASRNGIDLCGAAAIGAHCRALEYAGGATKPSDDLTWPLCHECHTDQELYQGPQPEWWLQNVLKPMMRRRYREWRANYAAR